MTISRSIHVAANGIISFYLSLSNSPFYTFIHIYIYIYISLKKGMATHSSILVWRIPGAEEPGRLQSMGLQRVGHD